MTGPAKHTPGPMRVRNSPFDTFQTLIDEHENSIFAVLGGPDDELERPTDANAAELERRWNAYPALLAACKAAQPFCPPDVQDVLRAAIAKAEGGDL